MTALFVNPQVADMQKRKCEISNGMAGDDAHNIRDSLVDVRVALLRLQEAVAKHDVRFRTLFPHPDPIYKQVERSFFGAFDDIPRQIHAFAIAAREFAQTIGNQDLVPLGGGVQAILHAALTWAGAPLRNKRGRIKWKKSLSYVERDLVVDIENLARTFFASVYALPLALQSRAPLQNEEREFWERYDKLVCAEKHAELDLEPVCSTLLLLQCKTCLIFCLISENILE